MPLFNLKCEACGASERKLANHSKDLAEAKCRVCGGQLVRTPDPPTTQVKETLDNGLMTKRLERYADAERLARDNAKVR